VAEERLLADVIRDIHRERRSGALYISIVETSEDLFRVYFEQGNIYYLRYGSASGRDCLDILEYYTFHSATYFDGIKAPGTPSGDLPPTNEIIEKFARMNKTIKIR
jgi:hypothetical protein